MIDIKNIKADEVDALTKIVERERCRQDIFYFISEYVKIEDKDAVGTVIPFHLWDAQKDALTQILGNRLTQFMKANQLGLTWLIIVYAAWNKLFKPGYSVKAISETQLKAEEIVRRDDFILRHLPDFLVTTDKNLGGTWYEKTVLSITIHHPGAEDSDMQAFASSPKAGAGFTANLFFFDEWALQEYAREIWTYAYPTINRPTGGQVIGISTIERGTLFEEIWRTNKNFKKIFLPWFTDPRRDQKWYDNTTADLGRDETLKHYPATQEEALAIPGGAFFDKFNSLIHIRDKEEIPIYHTKYRTLDYGLDMLACYFIYIDSEGFARIYKEIYKSNLVISEAAYEILKASGADVPETAAAWSGLPKDEKHKIALTAKEKFTATLAPPDLFQKSKTETGRSLDLVWAENGIPLLKAQNKLQSGCGLMKQWFNPIELRDVETGNSYATSKITIERGSCPNLVHSLLNIQKSKLNPEIWEDKPGKLHELTHAVTSVMNFCTEFQIIPINKDLEKRKELEWYGQHPFTEMLGEDIKKDYDLDF